jgi:ABC-2 type transport system permease protein
MTATVSLLPAAGTSRPSAPSLGLLTRLEVRKSLSTRSGKAVAAASALLAPAAVAVIAAASSEPLVLATGPLAVMGMLTGYILLALGVLSSAGEWSHRTVQTTFLLVPHRGRVVAAKALAAGLMGAAFAAVSTALSAGALFLIESRLSWDGSARAMLIVVAAGAVFAVTGVGVGAALGNTPAALTGLYLVILGVMPVLHTVKPAIATKVDPANAVLELAQGNETATSIAVLSGWVLVAMVAGTVMTRRRAVQ